MSGAGTVASLAIDSRVYSCNWERSVACQRIGGVAEQALPVHLAAEPGVLRGLVSRAHAPFAAALGIPGQRQFVETPRNILREIAARMVSRAKPVVDALLEDVRGRPVEPHLLTLQVRLPLPLAHDEIFPGRL